MMIMKKVWRVLFVLGVVAGASRADTIVYLEVQSEFGSPVPGIGLRSYTNGTVVGFSVDSPVSVDGKSYRCTGWEWTEDWGGFEESGASNSVEKTISTYWNTLEWTWERLDLDLDEMDDGFEMRIVNADPADGITSVEDVLGDDDFDGDGVSNAEEFAVGSDPLVADSPGYNTVSAGVNLLVDFLGEEGSFGHVSLAEKCFDRALVKNPTSEDAFFYRAGTRLFLLKKNVSLNELGELFGVSYNMLLGLRGELDTNSAPSVDWAVDDASPELLTALGLAMDDLDSIASNWTGTIEVSTNQFPLDETVFVDYADVMFLKSGLMAANTAVRLAMANTLNVPYERQSVLENGVELSIVVDGSTNDWAGLNTQLIACSSDAMLSSAQVAKDASNVYVLLRTDGFHTNGDFNINGDACIEDDASVSFYVSRWGTQAIFSSDTANEWIPSFEWIATNNVVEVCLPIPIGFSVDSVRLDSIFISPEYWGESGELSSGMDVLGEDLLAAYPSVLSSVRSEPAMSLAESSLQEAFDLFLEADRLASNRTDALMHFVEYDPLYADTREEARVRIYEAHASLEAPVDLLVTNDFGEILFEEQVYLGAYFQSNYVTRALRPQFEQVLSQPLLNTLPDPTIAGIFPLMTGEHIIELCREHHSNVDYDAMPDSWEDAVVQADTNDSIRTVYDVIEGEDYDGDGVSNLQEYLWSRNPILADIFFENVELSQRPGTKLIDLYYDLYAGSNQLLQIELSEENRFENNFNSEELSSRWSVSGDAGWSVQSNCVMAPVSLEDSQSATIKLTGNFSAGSEVSFRRKISTEGSYDFLRFYAGTNQAYSEAGEFAWGEVQYSLSEDVTNLMWIYSKDASGSAGADTVWLDDIVVDGSVYSVPVRALSGHAGVDVSGGLGRHAVWDAGEDWPDQNESVNLQLSAYASGDALEKDSEILVTSVDTRDYSLAITSEHGNPIPSIGTHTNYCWKSAITCSVERLAYEDTNTYLSTGLESSGGSVVILTNVTTTLQWGWAIVEADSDGDGLPDTWEVEFFDVVGDHQPTDYSLNGVNTLRDCYIAGLNPKDPLSTFDVSVQPEGGLQNPNQIVLRWQPAQGREYSIYYSTNLMSGFSCIASNLAWPCGSFTNEPSHFSEYYQVKVQVEEE